ncbi:MAG: hypothetical protein ABJB69_10690 [Spartobacteria bacterium]
MRNICIASLYRAPARSTSTFRAGEIASLVAEPRPMIRVQLRPMADAIEKLTKGEPLTIDQLIEYLPALKEIPRAQLDNWAKGAAVLHRFRKGQIVCEEGEFGSTAYYIVSGTVDIFIHNPLAHLRTNPVFGFFGRSFSRMRSFMTDDQTDRRPEAHQRKFIGIDANVDLVSYNQN